MSARNGKRNGQADYLAFIAAKQQLPGGDGFAPVWVPDFLFDFQRSLVEWSLLRGRAAIFADCGLGKTPMQLVWAENVVRQTNKPVLILTPLGVSAQTIKEGEKFGIDCVRSKDGNAPAGSRVVVTNYERLEHFDPDCFAGVVCDESSILKNYDGATKAAITEFLRTRPYRLLCTATAAPNDYVELGTSAESLGELGYQDMLTRYFHKLTSKDHRGWGRTKYRMRGHAERDFWRWIVSWARAVRKPSDLGFEDGKFILPELVTREHEVKARTTRPGHLFDLPAETLEEQREERRRTLPERCEKVAALVAKDRSAVVWCHLNDEGDLLAKLIPGAVQVSGADSDEAKEEAFAAFASLQIRVLVTKPTIAGFGLNWQHCAHQTFFPSHSFEQYYQAVRRSWRFGQKRKVTVDLVTSEGEFGVMANLQRKAAAAEVMFARLVELMGNELKVRRSTPFKVKEVLPSWL
jgi:hypothetical protein